MSAKQTSDLDLLLQRTQALATALKTTSQHMRKAADAQAAAAAKRAFVLKAPYAQLVARGEATLVVKSQAFAVDGEELFLADSDHLYGSIVLSKAKPISLAEFRRRQKEHRIPDEERKAMWPRSRRLYAFTVEKLEAFDTPRAWQSSAPVSAPQLRYKRDPKDDELQALKDADKQLAAHVVHHSGLFARQIGSFVDKAMRLMDLPGNTRSLLSALKTAGSDLEAEYAKLLARVDTEKAEGPGQPNAFATAAKLSSLLKQASTFLPAKTRIAALTDNAIGQLETFVKLEAQFAAGGTVASEVGKAEVDGLYEVDENGNLVDLTKDDLGCEVEGGVPTGKLPVLKVPDPSYIVQRLKGNEPVGILTRALRKGRVGQAQFLVNSQPDILNPACVHAIVVLDEPEALESVSKLADPDAIDPYLLEEFDDDEPAFYAGLKPLHTFDPPLLLKQAPLGVCFGPAIELPNALAKADGTVTTGDVPPLQPLQRPAVPGSTEGITVEGSFCYCPACGEVMELRDGESCKGKTCPECGAEMRNMGETSQKELDRLCKESGKEAYVCPKCGYKTTFPADRKGSGRVCPKCGTQMVREQKSLAKQDDKPWMSFRGMSPDSVKELSNRDLVELYDLAQDLLKGPLAEATTMNGLSKEDVTNALAFLRMEMRRRGIRHETAKAGPSDRYAPVRSGSEPNQPCLKLEELMPHFHKEFRLRAPLVHLVGSVVNNGQTENDVDILIKGPLDEATAHVVKLRLGRMLPPEISKRCEFHVGNDDSVSRAGPFSAHVPLYDLIARRSDNFQTIVEMRDSGFEPMFLDAEEWLAKQDPYLKLPGKEAPTQSVLHLHFRGRTVHADFRIKAGTFLIGYTMAVQIAGRVPLMGSLEEAKRFARAFDVKGSRWNKALATPGRLYASPKRPEPVSWLRIKSEEFEPGEVGATRYTKGYMVAIAHPRVSYGERTPVFQEYFLEKDPEFQGLLTFRMLVGQGAKKAETSESEDSGRRTPEGQPFWVAMLSKSLLPSVVKRRAVNVGRIPPQGWSFLPPKLKSVVPKRFRYWLPSEEKERIETRNALVEEGFFTESNVRLVDGEFRRVMTKYFLYEPPAEDLECAPDESALEAKASPDDLVDHLRTQTETLTKAVQDLKIERMQKAQHRRDTCMRCKSTPTHECVWAGGRGRAWFCSKHFHDFNKNKANEVIKWRRIEGGEVGKKYGDAPLDKQGKQPAYWDPHNPNPKVAACGKPHGKKKPAKKADEDIVEALAKRAKAEPNAIVTVACQGDMGKALVAMLETIKAHCNWGASRSWSIDDEQIAKKLRAQGYATTVGFDGDGADRIVDITLTPVLAKALHDELVSKGAGRVAYALAWQRWKGQVVIRAAPSRQVFHLYLRRPDGIDDFQILTDPSKARRAAAIHRKLKGSKVGELLSFEGEVPPGKKVGGINLNPSKDTASTVSILARGQLFFTADEPAIKKFKIGGKGVPAGLAGVWTLQKEEGARDTWLMTKAGEAKKSVGDTSPSVPRPPTAIQDAPGDRISQEKRLSPAQQQDYDRETAQIRENSKKPAAQRRHKFKAARWTHPNGHPRCLVCGDEERGDDGVCRGRKKTEKGYFETHTTADSGHSHHAFVDEYTGNGITGENALDQAGSGHVHDIIHWVVQPAEDGHTHNIGLIAGVTKGVFETHTTEDHGHSHHVYVDEFTGNGLTSDVEGHNHSVARWRVEPSGHTHSIGLIQGVEPPEVNKGFAEVHTGDYEGHSHRAYVDEYTGDGETAENYGHKHFIERWQVLMADSRDFGRHAHTMGVLPGEPEGGGDKGGAVAKKESVKSVTMGGKTYADVQVWDPKDVKPSDDKTKDRERLRPLALYQPMKVSSGAGNEFHSSELQRLYEDFATPRMLEVGLAIEPKWNGWRFSLQKDAKGRVLLISEEIFERKTELRNFLDGMPGLRKEVEALPGPFVLDGEFTAVNKAGDPIPRRELAAFRAAGKIDDEGVRLKVFDILYHPKKGNVVASPYRERRRLLSGFLRKSKRIELSPFRVVRSKAAMQQALSWARRQPGSEGAMLKSLEMTVTLKQTSMMAKFKAIRRIKGIVWEKHPVKGSPGVFNFFYAVGPVPKTEAESWAETVEVKGKIYVKAGRTFNAKLAANVGDVIRIEVTEIFYDVSNPEKRRIRGFTPMVIDKTSEGPSSIKEILSQLEAGETKKSAAELQDAIAKSVGLGDWSFVAKQQKEDERYVLGVVLVPNEYDSQGDIYDEDTVRKASEYFMEHARTLGLMHETALTEKKVKILENYVAPCDLTIDGQRVKKGTWLLAARILDDKLWQAVKAGSLTGWSIEGSALAQFVE